MDTNDIRIERLGVRSGQAYDSPNVGVVGATNRARRQRGELYYLIEPALNSVLPESLYAELIRLLSDAYYGQSGSVTRGLRAALLEANALLFERNLRADSQHRVTLGLCCVVVREEGAYIGQLGPAMACHVQPTRVVRYPADSTWLRTAMPGTFDLDREPPAGLRRDLEPDLYHAPLSEGDVLLLSSTNLARLASDRDISKVVASAKDSVAGRLLGFIKNHDLSVLVVDARPESARVVTSQPAPTPTPVQASETAPETASPPMPATSLPPAADAPAEQAAPAASATPVPKDEEAFWDEETYAEDDAATTSPRDGDHRGQHMKEMGQSISDGLANARRGARDLLLQVLPDSLPEKPAPQPRRQGSMSLSGKALVLVAMAIPLVMMFLVIMTRVQYERTRREQFSSIQTIAQSRYDDAVGQPDRVAMRQGLRDALDTVEDGLSIDPNDESLGSLQRRIQHKLDELDKVSRLYHFWKLVELDEDAISPTDASRIVVQGIDVYLLNRGSDRVFKYLLNDVGDALQSLDPNPILVQKGELLGGVRLGDMVDIAWLAAGGQRTLSTFVVLDRTGSLLVYDPQQGIDVLPVADSDIWLKPEAIGSYYGNLYVLDPLLDRILKYVPENNAYTVPPSDYINPQLDVDLTGAVDMTIDGNLYVLFADGAVKKFYRGEALPFTLQDLPSPMRSPTTITVSGEQEPEAEGYVYVTDTGNERILEFDKNGTFRRQFCARQGEPYLKHLRGLYVDQATGRMFILSGRTLWMADVPPISVVSAAPRGNSTP